MAGILAVWRVWFHCAHLRSKAFWKGVACDVIIVRAGVKERVGA
jgi:hypothetical protein